MTDRDGSSPYVSLGHVGGSSWWCPFVTVCRFTCNLENMFADCPNWDGSRQPVNCDGWCRFVTICQFVRVLENNQSGVMEWMKMSADRLDRDGSGRPVTTVEILSTITS